MQPIKGWEHVKVKNPNTISVGVNFGLDEDGEGLPPASDARNETLPGYDPEEIYPDEPGIPYASSPHAQDQQNSGEVPDRETNDISHQHPQYPPNHQNRYPHQYYRRPRRQIPEDLQDMIMLGVGLFFIWIALLIFT
ncbi:hypothetical protein [Pontiella desulfatans]|uniref:hypothetical protein n=1 Tax=Pontiella desulfatans TaxID=2750659 RepID=UPI00109D6EED|nr:hypothetical protein [Pontiella desulfatans]